MGSDADRQIAVEEMRRAGIKPHGSTGFTILVRSFSGAATIFGLGWYLNPGTGTPPLGREEAVQVLAVSVPILLLGGLPGRWWASLRLQSRASLIAHSTNRAPGVWNDQARSHAGLYLGFLTFLAVVFLAAAARRATSIGNWVDLVQMSIVALLAPLLVWGAVANWRQHRRYGGSRVVPNLETWSGGQQISGVLETTPLLAVARALRFELVTQITKSWWYLRFFPFPLFVSTQEGVETSVSVPSSAFATSQDLTVVPFVLDVPLDAVPSFETSTATWHSILGHQDVLHEWVLRATADIDGFPYKAEFPVKVVASPS